MASYFGWENNDHDFLETKFQFSRTPFDKYKISNILFFDIIYVFKL